MNNLYEDLNNLVEANEAFFKKEFSQNGYTYEIFNYRLAAFSDFLLPNAMNCRGTMFRDGEIVSLPMAKFFNRFENLMTMDVDLLGDVIAMEKRDGSLISTYLEDGLVRLKTKGSLSSEQAIAATEWFNNNEEFRKKVHDIMDFYNWDVTVNCEWTAPNNRVVVPYQTEELVILNVRKHDDGELVPHAEMGEFFDESEMNMLVESFFVDKTFVDSIPSMSSDETIPVIEGFVIQTKDIMFKVKTDRYIRLHRSKDSITNPKALFAVVINEESDDLRSMFHDDGYMLSLIDDMEQSVIPKFNHMVSTVEQFFNNNKELSRKDYAIKGTSGLGMYFSLAMNLFLGKDNDYRAIAVKNVDSFLS